MKFTYEAYTKLVNNLKEKGYEISDYTSCDKHEKVAILRHDIDNSLEKAIALAKLEQKLEVSSTYFVLLTSTFYNIFNNETRDKILEIHKMGHNIGLHFDELNYNINDDDLYGEKIKEYIKKEISIMANWLGIDICAVSMHRPSSKTLQANYNLGGWQTHMERSFSKSLNIYRTVEEDGEKML